MAERWRRKIDFLKGKLLIAMPNMGDTRFERAVIFMCDHDENGAMGLIVNQTIPQIEFSELVSQLKIESDITLNMPEVDMIVMNGGPVEAARGFLLHSSEFSKKDTVKFEPDYGVTGTVEALKDVVTGQGPEKKLFMLGYAGWGAGQLEAELQHNSWLVVEPDPAIIFHNDNNEKWTMAIGKLGFEPGMLSTLTGCA
ncbi:MAG: YqgE/AlgH family protein [Alphaproteobacteria bacterium]|nr:YqgE/AlgH family protein [Alphaproteobacteria bacterium]